MGWKTQRLRASVELDGRRKRVCCAARLFSRLPTAQAWPGGTAKMQPLFKQAPLARCKLSLDPCAMLQESSSERGEGEDEGPASSSDDEADALLQRLAVVLSIGDECGVKLVSFSRRPAPRIPLPSSLCAVLPASRPHDQRALACLPACLPPSLPASLPACVLRPAPP